MQPKIIEIQPSYKKESGVWVLDFDDISLTKDFLLKQRAVVYMPPQKYAGNHKHPRTELFLGIGGGMEFIWLDENNEKHIERMNPDGKILLIQVPPFIPHVTHNNSDSMGIIIEFADAKQTLQDVERVNIL